MHVQMQNLFKVPTCLAVQYILFKKHLPQTTVVQEHNHIKIFFIITCFFLTDKENSNLSFLI